MTVILLKVMFPESRSPEGGLRGQGMHAHATEATFSPHRPGWIGCRSTGQHRSWKGTCTAHRSLRINRSQCTVLR